jgi:hypothetical protein
MVVKSILRRVFWSMGYDVHRLRPQAKPDASDLEVYRRNHSADSIAGKWFYNIGAGTFRHPFWTNIDLESEWYRESQAGSEFINFDLFSLGRLPILDESAEVVYSSHTVEHVNDAAAQNMFNEAHRILRRGGGIFRVTTPNIDLDFRAMRESDRDYFYWIDSYSTPAVMERCGISTAFSKASLQQIVLFNFATHVCELILDDTLKKIGDGEFDGAFSSLGYEGALDYFTSRCSIEVQRRYPGYHMNWWNEKKAIRMLREAGFDDVYRSGYGQSYSPALRNTSLFDLQDPKVSIYVEARK